MTSPSWHVIAWSFVETCIALSGIDKSQAIRDWNCLAEKQDIFGREKRQTAFEHFSSLLEKRSTFEQVKPVWKRQAQERKASLERLDKAIQASIAYATESFDSWTKGNSQDNVHGFTFLPLESDSHVPLTLIVQLEKARRHFPKDTRKLAELAGIERLIYPKKRQVKPGLPDDRKAQVKTVPDKPQEKILLWRRLKIERNHFERFKIWHKKRLHFPTGQVRQAGFVYMPMWTNVILRESSQTFTKIETRFYGQAQETKQAQAFQETFWQSAKQVIKSRQVCQYQYRDVLVPICIPSLPNRSFEPDLTDKQYCEAGQVIELPTVGAITRAIYGRPRQEKEMSSQFSAFDRLKDKQARMKEKQARKQARELKRQVQELTRHVNRNLHKA